MLTWLSSAYKTVMETVAVVHYVYVWVILPIVSIGLPIYLLTTRAWFIVALYLIWYFYDFNFYRESSLWKHFADYFPLKLIKTADLPPDRNYIIGCHPHGVLSIGAFTALCTDGTSFSKLYPNLLSNILTLNGQFYFPIRREIGILLGGAECSRESLRYLLEHPGKGRAIGIVVGGAQEVLDAHANRNDINILQRTGFVRFALKHGADLVPSYSFGENDVYRQTQNPLGSPLRNIQNQVKAKCGFCPPLFMGRSIFGIPFGILPYRRPITTVIGAPIRVTKIEGEPTEQQIQQLHTEYCHSLNKLFDSYKHLHSIPEDKTYWVNRMMMLPNDSIVLMQEVSKIGMDEASLLNVTKIGTTHMAPATWQTWGVGLTSVAITAFAPSVGILLVPLLSKSIYERFMTFLVALGVGTLSGSTIYILIPQAFGVIDTIGQLSYINKASVVISAIYAFFTVDRALAYLIHFKKMQSKRRKIRQSTLDAVMSDDSNKSKQITMDNLVDSTNDSNNNKEAVWRDEELERDKTQFKNELEVAIVSNALTRTFSSRQRSAVIDTIKCGNRSVLVSPELNRQLSQMSDSVFSRKSSAPTQNASIAEKDNTVQDDSVSMCIDVVEQVVIDTSHLEVATVAYMIIFGSSANNFVDGMSIGAAFSDSFSDGLSIGIAVIAQQFPQELGTLAILVKSGLGFKRTLLLNLIPNSLSFLGFITGVFLGGTSDAYEMYIFSISSGMYLYIFLGTLIPEIRDSVNELIKTDLKESILSTALQALGIGIGVTFMYLMSLYGRDIHV
ncbi:2-acylglycerol O-acyltransferase 1 [Toxocara canis]|uniref:2-acylglycerol O-acyltransferase 1 n=1 Tax=Toxocara canis TaxID=6265 RepID=A0A0B2URS1_TOXCA|nr:2-acylglycerol O-acyltransferase 1 [Toxocara canis]